ncbi:MAG: polysaccharide biosynthesis/export family protein [Deltaproteobacteria bacterium]|nr:polysaccharide biosynthesis/export family protein [Deltaproteobacteria bacterium]MBW2072838.1 polysaccharide biosynthesis/export family protein [Deltaproteobacteria bacterium]
MTRTRLFAMFVMLLLVGCGGSSKVPSVSTLNTPELMPDVAPPSEDSYVIGPGDVLAIDVWKEPELTKQVAVRLDGKISLPLLNDIDAAGHTCQELQSLLTKKYQDFVTVPQVSVTLIESRSKKIYILGKVNRPGEYLLQKQMTILQAISLAGGLGEWADRSNIRLIRKIDGRERNFRVDYDAIVSGKDLSQNIHLQPDDTIFVP